MHHASDMRNASSSCERPVMSAASVQDDDGAAYIAYSSEGNRVMHFARLAPNLDNVAPGFERALVGQSRESPVIFKHSGVYFLFTSGCTGWESNRAEVFYSRSGAPYGRLPAAARAARCSHFVEHAGLSLLPTIGRIAHSCSEVCYLGCTEPASRPSDVMAESQEGRS